MKYKIPSLLILFLTAAFAFGNEQATNFHFGPDGHYDIGKTTERPGKIFAATEVNIALSPLRHVQVALTAAQINGMYATPVVLVAAQGSGKSIVVSKVLFRITRTATAFANGGAAIIQYAATTHGGGTQALDSTLASTVITGAAGTSDSFRNGAVVSDAASTVTENVGLYISNATGAFDTGTGTATVDLWYYVIG